MNARDCTFGAEWQCGRYAQGRVAVPLTRSCTPRAEWQCHLHCHSMASVRGSASHTATRCRAYQDGTPRAEWQCHSHCHSMVSVRGSATHTATRCRAYQDGTPRAGWQCHLHGAARPGPSGSVSPGDLRANRRCADAKTCLQGAPLGRASSERARALPRTVLPRAARCLLAGESLGRSG